MLTLFQYWREVPRNNLAICREAQRTIDDLDFALGQPVKRVPELSLIRSRALAKQGRHDPSVVGARTRRMLCHDERRIEIYGCCRNSKPQMQKVPPTSSPKGSFMKRVGATGRLLNFF